MFLIKFVYRLLRSVVLLIGLGTIAWWGFQYYKVGSPFRQQVDNLRQSGIIRQGVEDMKTLGGEVIKGVKGKADAEMTAAEKKQLEDILGKAMGNKKDEEPKKQVK